MATFGYARVSVADQKLDRQLIAMNELKIPPGNTYTDKQSGKNTTRLGLQNLLATVGRGDVVIVESVSRKRNAAYNPTPRLAGAACTPCR